MLRKFVLLIIMGCLVSSVVFGEPLHDAIQAGDLAQVKKLLGAGADINSSASGKGGMTPLNYAAYEGHLEIVKLLLDKGAEIDTRDNMSFTPLLVAAISGHQEVQKELIIRGADVNLAERSFGWTTLHRAAANGHLELIQLLLDKGAQINIKNKKGDTPLAVARQKGKTKAAELLKSRGGLE